MFRKTLLTALAAFPISVGFGARTDLVGMAKLPDGAVSLAALEANGRHDFEPDFSSLADVTQKTSVGGYVTNVCCFICTKGNPEEHINVNAGTTQYQGHYVWKDPGGTNGFGTYTADKTSRSFGWVLHNDTGKTIRCEGIDVTFGQWGARNTQPDTLSVAWRFTTETVDWSTDDDWTSTNTDAFVSPALSSDAADFPLLVPHSLTSFPRQLPPHMKLALRFTDACPPKGSNAHLGIARLRFRLTSSLPGLAVFIR